MQYPSIIFWGCWKCKIIDMIDHMNFPWIFPTLVRKDAKGGCNRWELRISDLMEDFKSWNVPKSCSCGTTSWDDYCHQIHGETLSAIQLCTESRQFLQLARQMPHSHRPSAWYPRFQRFCGRIFTYKTGWFCLVNLGYKRIFFCDGYLRFAMLCINTIYIVYLLYSVYIYIYGHDFFPHRYVKWPEVKRKKNMSLPL